MNAKEKLDFPLEQNREEIFDLYVNQKLTIKQVGEQFGFKYGKIRQILLQLDIPIRPKSESLKGRKMLFKDGINPRKTIKEVPCCICGKPVLRKPSELKYFKNPVCSKKCKSELNKINNKGKKYKNRKKREFNIEAIINLYVNKRKSSAEIAKVYNSNSANILKILKTNNIEIRKSGTQRKYKHAASEQAFNPIILNELFNIQRLSFNMISKILYTDKNTIIGLIKKFKIKKEKISKKVKLNCDFCDKEVFRTPALIKDKILCFCNVQCYGLWMSKNRCGENNVNFLGGKIGYRGPSWPYARNLARLRDNKLCQRCGIEESELNKELDVHHIKPFREFGLKRHLEANDLSNLICYCPHCHLTVERNSNIELFVGNYSI